MTILYEVQEAVYKRLENDSSLNEKIKGVFDYVPEETDFPYVILGRIYSVPEKTKTTIGERVEITIDIWSTYKGKKETIDIIKLVESALKEELEVGGLFVIDQKVKSREVLEEINELYHGTLTYEILIDME